MAGRPIVTAIACTDNLVMVDSENFQPRSGCVTGSAGTRALNMSGRFTHRATIVVAGIAVAYDFGVIDDKYWRPGYNGMACLAVVGYGYV